jgi:hypothetical protein
MHRREHVVRQLRHLLYLFAILLLPAASCVAAPISQDTLQLPDGTWVVASDDTFWLYLPPKLTTPSPGARPVSGDLTSYRNDRRTHQLLTGVVSAAWTDQPLSEVEPAPEQFTLPRYLFSLASAYQTAAAEYPMMHKLGARLRALGKDAQAQYCEEVARNAYGHDNAIIEDLGVLRIDAPAFLQTLAPPGAVALVHYFEHLIDSDHPIAAVGYVYALQTSSLLIDKDMVQKMVAALPPGVDATRTLRIRSDVGGSVRHVKETEEFIATLPASDRRLVALTVFDTITLMKSHSHYPGDEVVNRIAQKFKLRP